MEDIQILADRVSEVSARLKNSTQKNKFMAISKTQLRIFHWTLIEETIR